MPNLAINSSMILYWVFENPSCLIIALLVCLVEVGGDRHRIGDRRNGSEVKRQ